MWKLKLRQIGSQPENVPPGINSGRFNSTYKSNRQSTDLPILQKTRSLPPRECLSKDIIYSDDAWLSGYSTDPSLFDTSIHCTYATHGSRHIRRVDREGTTKNKLSDIRSRKTAYTSRGFNDKHADAVRHSFSCDKYDWTKRWNRNHVDLKGQVKRVLSCLSLRQTRITNIKESARFPIEGTFSTDGGTDNSLFDTLDELEHRGSRCYEYKTNRDKHANGHTRSEGGAQRTRQGRSALRPWSMDEEQALVSCVEREYRHMPVIWDAVATKFRRTDVGCMTKYYSLTANNGE